MSGAPGPPHELERELTRLAEAWRGGRPLLVLADFDGTLAEIVDHPAAAAIAPAFRAVLARLAARPRTAVGIVSARGLRDLEERARLDGIYYAGSSGLELEHASTVLVHPAAEAAQPLVHRAARAAAEAVVGFDGAWIERKPLGFTVHYRAVARAERDTVPARARAALAAFGDRLTILPAPMAVEVTPAIGWTKGDAVRAIEADVGRGVRCALLYAGDAAADVDALAATRALGGVAISVGGMLAGSADHRLADPAALASALARLDDLLVESIAASPAPARPPRAAPRSEA